MRVDNPMPRNNHLNMLLLKCYVSFHVINIVLKRHDNYALTQYHCLPVHSLSPHDILLLGFFFVVVFFTLMFTLSNSKNTLRGGLQSKKQSL